MKHSLALSAALLLGPLALLAQTTRVQRPVGGFIPGDYFSDCPVCESRYLGSKHSVCCEVCGKRREDEYLFANSTREVAVDQAGDPIFTRHLPAVDTKWLAAHGKEHYYADPVCLVGPVTHYQHIALAERFAQHGIGTIFHVEPERYRQPLRTLNDHWPDSLPVRDTLDELRDLLVERNQEKLPVFPSQYQVSYSYGGNGQPRQRWQARGGMFEKALTKRRKANKAAKKARKKSRN
jgi:hypothetical protein